MINKLRAGQPTYLSAVDSVSSDISVLNEYRSKVLAWANTCKMLSKVQLSSATAESLFYCETNDKRAHLTASVILQYNNQKVTNLIITFLVTTFHFALLMRIRYFS